MKNSNNKSEAETLRQKAEELLKGKSSRPGLPQSDIDALKLIHELEVHQVELEIQNEELRLTRTAAQDAAEKYTELYDFAPSGYFSISKKGEIIDLNITAAKMLGDERLHLKNSLFNGYVSADTRSIFTAFLEKVFDNQFSEICEIKLNVKGASPMYVHLSGIRSEDTDLCLLTATDITRRKLLEEELKTSKALLVETEKTGQIGGWSFDIETFEQTWTEETFCILEIDTSKEAPRVPEGVSFIRPAYLPAAQEAIKRAIEYGEPYDQEWEVITAKGNIRWVHSIAKAVRENGKIIRITGSFQDITKRKEVERKLKESADLYKLLFENANAAISIYNRKFQIVMTNKTNADLMGVTVPDLIGKSLFELFPDVGKIHEARFNEIIKSKHGGMFEDAFNLPDGSTKWFSSIIMPVTDSENSVSGVQVVAFNITARKEAESKILELNRDLELRVKQRTAELEEANKELEAFSYSISHDLHAPLRHIRGFIDLLLEESPTGQMTEDAKGYLEVISSSAGEMDRLIDAILSFSRLGKSEIRKTMINSFEMVQGVVTFFDSEVQKRKITIRVETLPEVNCDEELIKQVWTNVISNAIKYTGKKTEAIIDIGSVSGNTETTFFIKDNGAGFNNKDAGKLFGVFKRLHKSSDFEGTGIGLAIVNRIITRHGGRCWAEGEPGVGATFYFSLPK